MEPPKSKIESLDATIQFEQFLEKEKKLIHSLDDLDLSKIKSDKKNSNLLQKSAKGFVKK